MRLYGASSWKWSAKSRWIRKRRFVLPLMASLGSLSGPTNTGCSVFSPSRTRKITLSPIYEDVNLDGFRSSVGLMQRTHWQPVPGFWITKQHPVEVNGLIARKHLGKLVHKAGWPKNKFQEPGYDFFAWENLSGPEFRDQISLQSFSTRCLSPNSFLNPCPRSFGPPTENPSPNGCCRRWLSKNSAMIVSRYAVDRLNQANLTDAELEHANPAYGIMNLLAAAVAPIYEFGPHALKQRDCSGSLLSILAKMFLEDILAGFRCRHCVSAQSDLRQQRPQNWLLLRTLQEHRRRRALSGKTEWRV